MAKKKAQNEITIRSSATEKATIRNFRIVQNEGERTVERDIDHYNLQAIIAVGFKVNNERAVQFRKLKIRTFFSTVSLLLIM